MLELVRKYLDRYLVVIVLGLGLLFLGWSWFQTQQRLSEALVSNYEGLIRLDVGDNAIVFQRDAPTQRPALTVPGGFDLVDYNDRLSTITVNGLTTSLWDAAHGYAVDAQKHLLYHTIKGEGWTLTKEVDLGGPNRQLKISYYYTNPGGPSEVSLKLAHLHYYYTDPVVTAQGFTASIARATREETERNRANPAALRYSLRVSPNPNLSGAEVLRYRAFSEPANAYGSYNIWSSFESRPVLANERTLVGAEIVEWNDLK